MEKDYGLEYRKYVIGGVAVLIVVTYIIRLLSLQLMSDDYKKNADSNAFLKKIDYPSRGIISDRKGSCWSTTSPRTTSWSSRTRHATVSIPSSCARL